MNPLDASAKRTDVFPIVKHYIDALELYPMFEKHIPKPPDSLIEPGLVLCMIVANIICSSKPFYKIEEWVADYIDGIGEYPVNAKLYNDDQLGRTVDRLYHADRHTMMTEAVANAIRVYNLETKAIHNDSTSITFTGAYNGCCDENTVKLTQGFNKDHRPDCKQIVFGLNITEDGHVPSGFQLFDGNTTDDTTHIPNWEGLREFLDKVDFIYVADCKLCSADNLAYIAGSGGMFITLIPKNRKEVKEFYEYLGNNDVEWEIAYTTENSRKKGLMIVYSTYEGGKSSAGYRIIWVHSSSKADQDKIRRERKIEKVIENLKLLGTKLNRYNLKTEEQIEAAVKDVCKGVGDLFQVKIVEEKKVEKIQNGPGRPGPNTKFKEIESVSYRIEQSPDNEAIERKSETDGIFPLITNTTLEAAEVLKTYKKQPFLEKRMYTTKSILEVAPVFLKLPRRIETVMFLYFLALMIVSQIERNIRSDMEREKIDQLPILPQGMNTKHPTWNNLNYFFRNVYLSLIVSGGKIIKTTVKGMTSLHYLVVQLLEAPNSIYEKLKDGWWQFAT